MPNEHPTSEELTQYKTDCAAWGQAAVAWAQAAIVAVDNRQDIGSNPPTPPPPPPGTHYAE